jgi:hypothetical protein
MFLKFVAPERQKRSAASVHRVLFRKPGMFAAQVAPFDLMGCDSGVFAHIQNLYYHNPDKPVVAKRKSRFVGELKYLPQMH